MTKLLTTILSVILTISVNAQVTDAENQLKEIKTDSLSGWKKGLALGINANQTSLTNWAAGGQSSFALNTVFTGFVSYKSPKTAWDNTIDLGYGFLSQEDVKYTKKTDDKIDLMSKFGREVFKNFYYAILLNFKTQFTTGYKYPTDSTRLKISNFFAPAYLVGALGMDYKPNTHLSVFAAPLTGKLTFVTDTMLSNAGAFGVKKGETLREEIGGYVRVVYTKNDFKAEWLKNLTFTTKLDLFSNYLDNPQNVVVNWETLVIMKVNKYINVNLATQLIYDDKVKISKDNNGDGVIDSSGPRVQFKEIFGVGITFKL
ncbi:DUF3078 domain-containing protein [Tenuifilum osseticum]|uniref:DUF3078 domain-containing protein n=1 Tax=Tenuifilum osseticum TaxID=3374723 RepID=UPI0034E40018